MTERIDGAAFQSMILCAAAALESNRQLLNELNVFPVPDGDTGTNMSLTMSSAVTELQKKSPKPVGTAAETAASALLRGARGNSGVILSLLFRGISKNLKGKSTADALELAEAMSEGVDAAYKAVMKPAEGTILTVSRVATKAALEFAEAGSDVELMLLCAIEAAKIALDETIEQNPVLKRAGIIDAGGKGYVLILEAMLASIRGEVVVSYEIPAAVRDKADFSSFDTGDITFGYCTEFIVSRDNKKSTDLLRVFLETMGDSVVVVDDEEIIKTHVHTNEPGRVLTEALTYGALLTVKVENMREQHTELGNRQADAESAANIAGDAAEPAAPEKKYGAVAVCAGEGMAALFRELGADGIVTGGQTMNPSTEDILTEVNKTRAEIVYILPNNKNIIMAAEQCAPLTDKKIVVIPTTSVPQGVAAMLSLDIGTEEPECTKALNEAVGRVHTALVTYASRDSDFDGHDIKEGEYLTLMDGRLVGSGDAMEPLIDNLCASFRELSPEFISVYYGEDVTEDQARKTLEKLETHFPDAELSLISGGQPIYYYMISAE